MVVQAQAVHASFLSLSKLAALTYYRRGLVAGRPDDEGTSRTCVPQPAHWPLPVLPCSTVEPNVCLSRTRSSTSSTTCGSNSWRMWCIGYGHLTVSVLVCARACCDLPPPDRPLFLPMQMKSEDANKDMFVEPQPPPRAPVRLHRQPSGTSVQDDRSVVDVPVTPATPNGGGRRALWCETQEVQRSGLLGKSWWPGQGCLCGRVNLVLHSNPPFHHLPRPTQHVRECAAGSQVRSPELRGVLPPFVGHAGPPSGCHGRPAGSVLDRGPRTGCRHQVHGLG